MVTPTARSRLRLAGLLALALLFVPCSARALLPIEEWRTASGARVLFVQSHDLPMVDVGVQFPAGSGRDTVEQSGLAAQTLQALRLGGNNLSEEMIASQLAEVGAQLTTLFDADRAGYNLRSLSSTDQLRPAVEVLAGILSRPAFPKAALDRELARAVTSLRESDTRPETIASRHFARLVFRDHPYALRASGEPPSIGRLTAADLRRFHQSHYGARGAVVSIMGDLSSAQARELAERVTQALPDTPEPPALASVPALTGPAVEHIPHPAAQAHVFMGQPGIRRGDPDYFPLWVGNYVLGGGGFSSRLTEEVREKRGLSYSVYSYFNPYQQLGPLQIGLQTRRDQVEQAIAVVRETLQRFVREGPSADELEAAKQNIIGGFPLRIDSNRKLHDYLGVIGFYGLPLDYLEDFPRQVERVSIEQVREAFARRIDPSRMVTVIVGGDTPKP